MKITLYKFLALSEQEQYDIIFTRGEFLEISLEGNKRFVLYAIDLFFVEVEYNSNENKIINKKAFVSGEILDNMPPFSKSTNI